MTSKEALETLKDIAIYEENNNMCSDLGDCCDFKGNLIEVYEEEVNAIEKDLEVLEHLKQLFYGIKVLEAIGVKYTDMYNLIKNSDDNLIKEWLENESNND